VPDFPHESSSIEFICPVKAGLFLGGQWHRMHDLERWSDIRKLLERPGKITGADFDPDPAILEFLQNDARVLVVGAGASLKVSACRQQAKNAPSKSQLYPIYKQDQIMPKHADGQHLTCTNALSCASCRKAGYKHL